MQAVPVDPRREARLPAVYGQERQEPRQEAPRRGPHQALRLRQGRGAGHQIAQVVHRLRLRGPACSANPRAHRAPGVSVYGTTFQWLAGAERHLPCCAESIQVFALGFFVGGKIQTTYASL